MDASLRLRKGSELTERQHASQRAPIAPIRTVGIVGAGQMGNGIAHVVAVAGFDVALNDLKKETVDKARATIERNMVRQVSRALITDEEMQAALGRIHYAPDLDAIGEKDLVIEAATEDEAVKRKMSADDDLPDRWQQGVDGYEGVTAR